VTERFTFFWSGPFSQWFKSAFTLDGQDYVTAEQYMMAEKARLFGDEEIRSRILATANARKQKELGRQVRNFDAERWNAAAREVVYAGNRAKFTADPELLAALLATRGTTIVEASPEDRIWGIGLAEDDPAALDRATWRGTNWLGEVLTRLRDELIAEGKGAA
jgi:ribA/ribD-fused uncharacterized protein